MDYSPGTIQMFRLVVTAQLGEPEQHIAAAVDTVELAAKLVPCFLQTILVVEEATNLVESLIDMEQG